MRKRVRLLHEEYLVAAQIPVHVSYKNIKNLYLRVRCPEGRVEMSVPQRTTREDIESFISCRRTWIEERRRLICARAEKSAPQYIEGEGVLLWGTEYPLTVVRIMHGKAYAERTADKIVLYMSKGADIAVRRGAIHALYRAELAAEMQKQAPICERIVGRCAALWRIRIMKTRWGSCNTRTGAITLNLWLVRYDVNALIYVMMHELTHLWVRGHNAHFYERMDRYFPTWRKVRHELNQWDADEYL